MHTKIIDIEPTIIKILRLRWVDDIFFYIVSTELMEDETFEQIQNAFSQSYAPFSLKIEDPKVFVGFRHRATETSEGKTVVEFSIDTRTQFERHASQIPKFIHAKSNIPQAQTFGLFKGAIIRCIDCALSEDMCFKSILRTEEEFRFVGFDQQSFRQALRAVSKQYALILALMRSHRKL